MLNIRLQWRMSRRIRWRGQRANNVVWLLTFHKLLQTSTTARPSSNSKTKSNLLSKSEIGNPTRNWSNRVLLKGIIRRWLLNLERVRLRWAQIRRKLILRPNLAQDQTKSVTEKTVQNPNQRANPETTSTRAEACQTPIVLIRAIPRVTPSPRAEVILEAIETSLGLTRQGSQLHWGLKVNLRGVRSF